MKRAPFLVSPAAWTRSQPASSDPVRYACAVESPKPSAGIPLDEVALYVLAAVTVALFAWGVI